MRRPFRGFMTPIVTPSGARVGCNRIVVTKISEQDLRSHSGVEPRSLIHVLRPVVQDLAWGDQQQIDGEGGAQCPQRLAPAPTSELL